LRKKRSSGLRSGLRMGFWVLARAPMIRRDGGRSVGEAETVFVRRERMIMLRGSTERGPAREDASAKEGGSGGIVAGSSASVIGRRSEEEMCLREREADEVVDGDEEEEL
jgi:hypothetical protein